MFHEIGSRLREALGASVERIDHIGSTSVVGLAAKPIIDIQVSVRSFEPLDRFRAPIEECGFEFRPDNPERTKRYFRERPGEQRTHIHVRRVGSFSEQFSLLFRDFLRADKGRADEYAELKYELAGRFGSPETRKQYVEAKTPFVWETIRLADAWAQATGWQPSTSDC